VISGKYPSWMVRHDRHLRHMVHPLRGLYERYPAHLEVPGKQIVADVRAEVEAAAPDNRPGHLIDWALTQIGQYPQLAVFPGPFARAVIQELDSLAAAGISLHAAMSEHVARRPGYLPPNTEVLITPPLTDFDHQRSATQLPTTTERGGADTPSSEPSYLFGFGRLTPIKRFDLTIKAFAHSRASELRIAGSGPDMDRLAHLASSVPGVKLLGHCTEDELAQHLSGALAVVAIPEDEDYGLVATEAMAAGRPVVTTTDSGGVAEQVDHEITGLVMPPLVRPIASAIDRLIEDPKLAHRLGRAGQDAVAGRYPSDLVDAVRRLGSDPRPSKSQPVSAGQKQTGRTRVLILSTYPAHPIMNGGARRLASVARELANDHDVVVATLTNALSPAWLRSGGTAEHRTLGPRLRQVSVPRSAKHLKADHQMAGLVGMPVDDITCGPLADATPDWAHVVEEELSQADVIMLAHPFLVTTLPDRIDQPIIYDAHNVEADLKTQLLDGRPGRQRLLQWCSDAEYQAVERAGLVVSTSTRDGERLAELYPARPSIVVANGVDLVPAATALDRGQARRRLLADLGLDPADNRIVAVFMGSNHPPNHDAADELSRIAGENPDLIIVLAGTHSQTPRPHTYNLGRFGEASRLSILRGADVALNTVRAGSGTNLKLVEALGAGVPVVSTTVGARGIEDPSSVLTIADTGLANAIRRTASTSNISSATDASATGNASITGNAETKARVVAGLKLAETLSWATVVEPLSSWVRSATVLAYES